MTFYEWTPDKDDPDSATTLVITHPRAADVQPTQQQMRTAIAMLAVNPGRPFVAIPVVLPGHETGGAWRDDQPIEPVAGYWLASERPDCPHDTLPEWYPDRDYLRPEVYLASYFALGAAHDALTHRSGTAAYMVVMPDGSVDVYTSSAMLDGGRVSWCIACMEARPELWGARQPEDDDDEMVPTC